MSIIFDIDGTLTESGKQITDDMLELLVKLKSKYKLILVGGGNYEKIIWQMKNNYQLFDSIFSNCGSELYQDNKLVKRKNITESCDRKLLNELIRICLKEIANLNIIYSGNQIDFRSGLVYISPVGTQATDEERNIFIELDKKENTRLTMIEKLRKLDADNKFEIVLGGSVGFSIYPKGWNKAQILEYIKDVDIYFFGDRTTQDGNDYPLYIHPRVKGFSVKNYQDTYNQLINFLNLKN
jgi:phosphomannomutase